MPARLRKALSVLLTTLLMLGCFTFTAPTVAQAASHDNNVWWNEIYHDSHDLTFRSPFGAVPSGSIVTLRLQTARGDAQSVSLRVWDDAEDRELLLNATKRGSAINPVGQDVDLWEVVLQPLHPGQYWYRWVIRDGTAVAYYEDDSARGGGPGKVAANPEGYDYSITAYDPAFAVPDWLQNATIYQIFPDRFRNGSTANDPLPTDKAYGTDLVEIRTWNQQPDNPRELGQPGYDGDGVWSNDFFGGDLAGIQQKLDYLQSLGVTVLYLNPIMDAASNHRYDTSDYMQVDPYLGTDQEFRDLVAAAAARGMKVVLDGVFNHTGADSVYFDKFSKFTGQGAFESQSSPYYDWFSFTSWPNQYDAWWGYDSLPNLKEIDPVKNFIYRNTDSVAKHWLQEGAAGWRLDVYPEVSSDFWREFRQHVKATDPHSVMIGEVWDNAARHFLGDELDSTMNYRFRTAALQFLAGGIGKDKGNAIPKITAAQLDAQLRSIQEDYPPEVFYSLMNLVGSHDTNRILDALGYDAAAEAAGDATKLAAAKARLKMLAAWQFTYPGAPTIYYGDEAGLAGEDDPDSRRTFPWADQGLTPDEGLTGYYRVMGTLRAQHSALRTGDLRTLYVGDEIYAYGRRDAASAAVTVLNNRASAAAVTLNLKGYIPVGATLLNPVDSAVYTVDANGLLTVTVPATSAVVLVTQGGVDLTPPAAPAGLLATPGMGSVTLSWNGVADAASYQVYRSNVPGYFQLVTETQATTVTDTGLTNGQRYFYTVVATDAAGLTSPQAPMASAVPAVQIGWANLQWPPTMTYVLQAGTTTETAYGQVWVDGVTNQPGQGAGIYVQLGYGEEGTPPDSWTTWTDATYNVDNGNNDEYMGTMAPTAVGRYNYTFRYSGNGLSWYYGQLNEGGYGLLTVTQSSDTVPPGAPDNLTATPSQGQAQLNWTGPADADLYQYWIYRATASGTYGTEPVAKVPATQTGYLDQGLDPNATYYYVVRAVDTGLNRSQPSNEVAVQPKAQQATVIFRVTVPAYTPAASTIYVAGGFPDNDWNPAGIALTKVGDSTWQTTLTLTQGSQIAYKYTRGSWETVEKGAQGEELGNRTITVAAGEQTITDTVLRWRDLPLVVTAPADGLVTTAPSVTVTGNAYVGAAVKVNGLSVTQNDAGNFSAEVPLVLGENTLTVATSGEGELARTITLKVTREEVQQPPTGDVTLRVVPNVLPRKGHPKRIVVRVEGAEVDGSTLLLNGRLSPVEQPGKGNPGFAFDGAALIGLIPNGATEFELTLTGKLVDGSPFTASITVPVTPK